MSKIYLIRGQKVMLDVDLAELYDVETKQLKRAVRRNRIRFPGDFMFELNKKELDKLEVPIWHLKLGRNSLHTHGVHGTGSCHAVQYLKQRTRRTGYFCMIEFEENYCSTSTI